MGFISWSVPQWVECSSVGLFDTSQSIFVRGCLETALLPSGETIARVTMSLLISFVNLAPCWAGMWTISMERMKGVTLWPLIPTVLPLMMEKNIQVF